jgi:hypothetical protein
MIDRNSKLTAHLTTLLPIVAGSLATLCDLRPAAAGPFQPLDPVYRWTMPDFDQVRYNLPENFGSVHCVPTSHCNLLAYLSKTLIFSPILGPALAGQNAQADAMFPGLASIYYHPTNSFDNISNNIEIMGNLMETSLPDGTSSLHVDDGVREWPYLPLYTFTIRCGSEVSPWQMHRDMKKGGVVAFSFGRWELNEDEDGYDRTSGHCVTLLGAENIYPLINPTSDYARILFRDPGTAEPQGVLNPAFRQSEFVTHVREISWFDSWNLQGWLMRSTNSADGVRRILNRTTTLWPLMMYTLPPASNGDIQLDPVYTTFELPASPTSFNLSGITEISQGLSAVDLFAAKPVNGPSVQSQILLVDAALGQVTNSVIVSGSNPKIAAGRDGNRVYVAVGRDLRCLAPGRVAGTLVDGPTPIPLPGTDPVDAMIYDDQLDQPVLLIGGSIRTYNKSLALQQVFTMNPAPVFPRGVTQRLYPAVGASGRRSFWVGPFTGNAIRRYEADPNVPTRLNVAETISPPAGATVTDFQFSQWGTLLLNRSGAVSELRQDNSGRWVVDTNSRLSNINLRGSTMFAFAKSRSNFDPAIHVGPDHDVNPPGGDPDIGPGFTDCKADVGKAGGLAGKDGRLDNNDFVAFVSLFFSRDPLADLGSQGGVSSPDGQYDNNDFAAFVTEFFTPCGIR